MFFSDEMEILKRVFIKRVVAASGDCITPFRILRNESSLIIGGD